MTPHIPKACMASLGEAKFQIRRSQLPRDDVRVSRRVARVAHRRGASMSLAHWIFTFSNSELETQDATRRIAAAGPIPPQPRPTKHAHTQRCGMSLRRGGRVRSAARAPAVARRVIFVSDNNNGTHRIAKLTRWVVPTRRRRADLSDRGRGRRVVGRAIPRGGRA